MEASHDTTEPKAGAPLRIGAFLLALVLLFITAVAVIVMLDIGSTATCTDVRAGDALPNEDGECYDGSSTVKTIALVLGWPGSVLAGLATLLALAFTFTGRGGRRLMLTIAAAAILLGLSLIIG